ncbi:HIT family protein [Chitinibacteraceae bacterium HSL-7]
MMMDCELCQQPGGEEVWRDDFCRVVLVDDAGFPGFCRVIVHRHVAEISDLSCDERQRLMDTVYRVEKAVRDIIQPDKINLASLGNVVPHLHWHVIPRWQNDSHFPAPIWAPARRDVQTDRVPAATLDTLRMRLRQP